MDEILQCATHRITKDWFYEWFVGFTAGDGSFALDRQNSVKMELSVKIRAKRSEWSSLRLYKIIVGLWACK